MEIRVLSKQQAIIRSCTDFDKKKIIISIRDPHNDKAKSKQALLRLNEEGNKLTIKSICVRISSVILLRTSRRNVKNQDSFGDSIGDSIGDSNMSY